MKKLTNEELDRILEDHEEWLATGRKQQADLSYRDLRKIRLGSRPPGGLYKGARAMRHVILTGADMCRAELNNVSLYRAQMQGVNLACASVAYSTISKTDLSDANLYRAKLNKAILMDTKLCGADMTEASMRGCNLWGADLTGANLEGTDLTGADMSACVLFDANLTSTKLDGACLYNAKGVYCLPVHDPRGYRAVANIREGECWVYAGCRAFILEDAWEHWGPKYVGNRQIGDMYLRALDWLEAQLRVAA